MGGERFRKIKELRENVTQQETVYNLEVDRSIDYFARLDRKSLGL